MRKKYAIWIAILITILLVFSTYLFHSYVIPSGEKHPPNIILFSWDGFQRNHLLEMLRKRSQPLPNLHDFLEEGVFLNLTVIAYRTVTKNGHAQMITGYRGMHIGAYSNEIYFHAVPDGYTFLERVENYFGEDNVITGMITGKKKNLEVDKVAALDKRKYSDEGIFSYVPDDIDVNLVSEDASDIVGPRMIEFIENHGKEHFVAFFHFAEPDKQGHERGENSKEYNQGAKSCDKWLGKILDKLSEMKIRKRTLIYITTDHGFNEGKAQHRSDPDIWLVSNDQRLKINERETRCDMIDVAPTIYYALGINETIYTPKLDGFPLQEELPEEADSRKALLKDNAPPDIKFHPSINGTTITKNEPFEIKFNITDENEVAGYLLFNNSLINIYRNKNEHENKDNKLICVYNIAELNVNIGKYVIAVMAFDKGENLETKLYTIFIQEHE